MAPELHRSIPRARLAQRLSASRRARRALRETIAHSLPHRAAMTNVRVKFRSERGEGTKLTAKTVKDALAALVKARPELQKTLEEERFRDFELCLSEDNAVDGHAASDVIAVLDSQHELVADKLYVAHLTQTYALRASTHPTHKYVVGRFKGQKTPTFVSGENAPVEWQMRRSKSDIHGNTLNLSGGRKPNKGTFLGTRDSQGAAYFVLMSRGKEFVAMPCEEWYTFSHNAPRRVFTLEEAEAKMEAGKRAIGETWGRMDKSGEPGYSDDESGDRGDRQDDSSDDEDTFGAKKKGKKKGPPGAGGVDSDDEDEPKKSGKAGVKMADEEGEDWEHDQEWDDDEDEVAIPEDEEAPKDPNKKHDDSDAEEEGLDKQGLAVKKLLGKQEKMDAGQFSDSDSDSELEEDFNPDNDDIGANVVGSFVERSKKLEEEEKTAAAASPPPMAKSASVSSIGVKRTASDVAVDGAPVAKVAKVATPAAPVQSPIEETIIDIVRKNPDSTTVKLITKTCRKKGLLNSTAGAEELKTAIKNLLVMKKLRDGSQVLVLK